MSWHIETVGTAEDVTAAIDEETTRIGGMPSAVGMYLKEAISSATAQSMANYLVHVESAGHRPMNGAGIESCKVRIVRRGAWKP